MKSAIAVFVVSAAMGAATLHAQTPQSTQQRPDARYSNPSGQDSAPSQTTVPPTKTAPPSSHPEDPATTSTKGKAAEQTYQTGKKADDNAGCSTPTDAQSAGVTTSRKTVCTTSGADGVGAVDQKSENRRVAEATSSQAAPSSAKSSQAAQSPSSQSKAPKESPKETAESAAAAAPECKEISATKPGHCNPSQSKPQPPR